MFEPRHTGQRTDWEPYEYDEAPELKPDTSPHWKPTFSTDWWMSDTPSIGYWFDANRFVQELSRKMREAEDSVAEPLVVDWLRSRGWTVEKEGEEG